MALPSLTSDGLLPPGDYPMTFAELRDSYLVTGRGGRSGAWDAAWEGTWLTRIIRSEAEYKEALRRLERDRVVAVQQQEVLSKAGLTPDEVQRAMEPLLSTQAQLAEEIDWYERVRRREFPVIRRLTAVGRLLIALRIANGMNQRELANRLGVSEAVVSRDELNEYRGITLERAQRILDVLQAGVAVRVEEPLSQEDVRELTNA